MLQLSNKLNSFKIAKELIKCNYFMGPYDPALCPVVKTHRKPRWVPIAKSKKFRIPVRPNYDQDEVREARRLNNNYRNKMNSLEKYFYFNYNTKFQQSLDPEQILKEFKEDLLNCHQINDEWNASVKIIREKNLQKELQEDMERAEQETLEEITKEHQIYELAEKLIKEEKAASVNFITAENIDRAIDEALAETVDYNFAITLNGEKIMGRETKPAKEPEQISVSQ